MTKVKAIALIQLVLISLCLLVPSSSISATADQTRFTILHTNDLHSHAEPFLDKGKSIGGIGRISHLIQQTRKTTPNVVVVDAGDIFQGTPYFKFYHGEVEVELLNKAGYDIYTIGNHEFDDGPANLAKQLKNAKFEIIVCNVDASSVPELAALFKPSTVREIDGQKVGFIGAMTPFLGEFSLNMNGVKVNALGKNWMEPIAAEVKRLQDQGVNKIVIVSHIGVELEKDLAAAVPGIDVIIGGHSHTRLNKPIVVRHEDGSKALVVQTGSYGKALGKLDLAFDNRGEINMRDTKYKLINIDSSIPEDEKIADYLTEKSKPFIAMRHTVAGVAMGDFNNQFRRYPYDSPLGNLIADALADAGAKYGATISMQNRGGIRGSIDRGMITLEKVNEVLPFENTLVVATIDGRALLKALENSVSGHLGARFLDVHGLKFSYDKSAPIGNRISNVRVETTKDKWEKLDLDGKYRIAVNDYSFKGGESYDFSTATDIVNTGLRLSNIFQDYLVKQKKVYPQKGMRITAIRSYRDSRNRSITKRPAYPRPASADH